MKKRFVILNLYIAIIKNDRIEIIMETRICNSYARKKTAIILSKTTMSYLLYQIVNCICDTN